VFAVVFFHRIYESVGLGNASFDHQPPSKLVAPVRDSIVRPPASHYNLVRALRLHRPLRRRHAVHGLRPRRDDAREGAQCRARGAIHGGPSARPAGLCRVVRVGRRRVAPGARAETAEPRAERSADRPAAIPGYPAARASGVSWPRERCDGGATTRKPWNGMWHSCFCRNVRNRL
jgi:hypothetical protein